MNLRGLLLGVSSFAFGVFLISVLVKTSRVSPLLTFQQIRNVHWMPFVTVVALNICLVLVSTEKWQAVDAAIRNSSDTPQTRTTAFALTSAGLAIGTFLPVQIAMSTTRTIGTHGQGNALKRGAAGTLYEQGFDVLTTLLLAIGSAATWLLNGGAIVWALSMVLMMAAALLLTGPSVRLIHRVSAQFAKPMSNSEKQIRKTLRNLAYLLESGVLGVPLARRLVLLSCARFVVIVLMSIGTAEAVGLHISPWKMAAATPFVAISSVIALTPGGLGVNEITSVGGLGLFGISLAISSQWVLANRVLITVSYYMVAICGAGVSIIRNWTELLNRSGARN